MSRRGHIMLALATLCFVVATGLAGSVNAGTLFAYLAGICVGVQINTRVVHSGGFK